MGHVEVDDCFVGNLTQIAGAGEGGKRSASVTRKITVSVIPQPPGSPPTTVTVAVPIQVGREGKVRVRYCGREVRSYLCARGRAQ